jgi:hypothetical protein
LAACNDKPVNNQEAVSIQSDMKPFSPFEGSWELVSNEVVGHKINLSQHQQFKVFNGKLSFRRCRPLRSQWKYL